MLWGKQKQDIQKTCEGTKAENRSKNVRTFFSTSKSINKGVGEI